MLGRRPPSPFAGQRYEIDVASRTELGEAAVQDVLPHRTQPLRPRRSEAVGDGTPDGAVPGAFLVEQRVAREQFPGGAAGGAGGGAVQRDPGKGVSVLVGAVHQHCSADAGDRMATGDGEQGEHQRVGTGV
ncbi:hypothetical protein [Streptomyces murinus]|uniref:hypothetical protein n=1 Tax=Streptomyces murinus TaxID=33900 RepID=UPI0037FD9E30